MTQDLPSATKKPRLDDLLATMGITHEQLSGMTAEDLFAAATRCQDAASIAAAETQLSRLSTKASSTACKGDRRARQAEPIADCPL